MHLESIRALVQEDMQALEAQLVTASQSSVPLVNQVTKHLIQSGGKRLRPLVLVLTARACGYRGDAHIGLGVVLEFVHTATLLHDDVVDDSHLRRGEHTANHRWGNAASVLVGDFLYSRAFELMVRTENFDILKRLAEATNVIAEGEVLQLMNRHNPDLSEATYRQIIECKTGKLFEVAAHLGAILANAPYAQLNACQQAGLYLGTAFQLIDDVLDYQCDAKTMGKNMGDDLAEGSPTLPLLYAMWNGNAQEKEQIKLAIQSGGLEHLSQIQQAIKHTNAIAYTAAEAEHTCAQAKNALTALPDSVYKEALLQLIEFTLQRQY